MARSASSIAVMAALAIACSSKGATPSPEAPVDGGVEGGGAPSGDAATADASGTVGGDSGTRATACTAAPFVPFSATVTLFDVLGTSKPLAGATIGFSTCPGFEITTDTTGSTSTQLTQGVPISPIFNATGVIDSIGAEIPATAAVTDAVTLFDDDVAPSIPGFVQDGGNAATIAITLQDDPAATAPCNVVSGVVLSVTGQPEAVVTYTDVGWPGNAVTLTSSSFGPQVFINGVQGAAKVAVTGALTGCAVNLVSASQTGSFQLVPGTLTIGTATITNP